ncbi:unnamed protein product [Lampetra fluviatilis]
MVLNTPLPATRDGGEENCDSTKRKEVVVVMDDEVGEEDWADNGNCLGDVQGVHFDEAEPGGPPSSSPIVAVPRVYLSTDSEGRVRPLFYARPRSRVPYGSRSLPTPPLSDPLVSPTCALRVARRSARSRVM